MDQPERALAIAFTDTESLAGSYLPWAMRGGIYLCTRSANATRWALGDAVFLCIELPFKPLPTFAAGCVVWRDNDGVGVEFDTGFDDLIDLLEECAALHPHVSGTNAKASPFTAEIQS